MLESKANAILGHRDFWKATLGSSPLASIALYTQGYHTGFLDSTPRNSAESQRIAPALVMLVTILTYVLTVYNLGGRLRLSVSNCDYYKVRTSAQFE